MSSDCEKQIIQCFCLHCKSFSPLQYIVPHNICYVKATRKILLSRGFGSFLMEYLMKKPTERMKEECCVFFLFQIKVLFDQRLIFVSDKVLLRPLFLSSPRIFSRDSPSFNNFPNAFLIFLSHKIICFYLGSMQTLLLAVYEGYCENAPSCRRSVPDAILMSLIRPN